MGVRARVRVRVRVIGLGFRVHGSRFRVLGFWVYGQGLSFWV